MKVPCFEVMKFLKGRCCPFIVQGKWTRAANWNTLVDPLNGEPFIKVSEVDESGIQVSYETLLVTKPCLRYQCFSAGFYLTDYLKLFYI